MLLTFFFICLVLLIIVIWERSDIFKKISEKQLRGGLRWPVHSVIKDLVKRYLFYKQDLLCKNGIEQVTILP